MVAGGPGVGCDFGTGESISFNTSGFVSSHNQYQPTEELSSSKAAGLIYDGEIEEIELEPSQVTTVNSREMIGYRVYRDGEFLVETDTNTFIYVDEDTEHDRLYCYIVKSVYTDGESLASNEACDEWVLMPATSLEATGTNGRVELVWNDADANDVLLGYNVIRDGEFLALTLDNFYNDETAIHGIE